MEMLVVQREHLGARTRLMTQKQERSIDKTLHCAEISLVAEITKDGMTIKSVSALNGAGK